LRNKVFCVVGIHIEANYDINKLNDRIVEIYQELIEAQEIFLPHWGV